MCHIIGRPIAEQKLSLSFNREKTSSLLKSKPSNVLVGGVCLYIRKNTNPNTAFAFPSSICNTIMGYLVVHLPLQNGSNGSYQKNELERPKHLFVRVEKFNEPIASCSECRIMQWAQLIYLCKVSIRATESKSRRIMSAVGTTLQQSPGCNKGKARYETLGIHEPKVISSSVGAALSARAFVLDRVVPPLWGSINVFQINPGLAPWAMREYRPCRALRRLPPPITILYCFDALTLIPFSEELLGYYSIY